MADDKPIIFDPVEDCPWCSPREILARYGYFPTPPTELTDQQLPGRLWELFYAAAARRIYFCCTDHLDDRTLYTLLWDEWLDEPTADIPLEAETNTNIAISEFNAGGMNHEDIWLRYYAEEEDCELFHSSDPNFSLPPREKLPYDRERFLPTCPIPLEAHAGWLPGDDEPANEEDDRLESDEIDDSIAAGKEEPMPGTVPDEAEMSKLDEQLRAMEPENWTPPAQQLTQQNIPLLPPKEITPEMLTPILWELIHNLSLRGFYLLHSNHLSDAELYGELWERGLRDPAHLAGRNSRGGWFHDFLGSWGDDETQLWLRFHATDEERTKHAQEWPKDKIPPKEKPIANRDWRLPKGPF